MRTSFYGYRFVIFERQDGLTKEQIEEKYKEWYNDYGLRQKERFERDLKTIRNLDSNKKYDFCYRQRAGHLYIPERVSVFVKGRRKLFDVIYDSEAVKW